MTEWEKAQEKERAFWGNCINTYKEETKQFLYAREMKIPRLTEFQDGVPQYGSVLDIGGGPVSLLLKVPTKTPRVVADPMRMPLWVRMRYGHARILLVQIKGEDLQVPAIPFDEVWMYNVLQHVEDPQAVIAKARLCGKMIRIFDWVDLPKEVGHINTLRSQDLDEWLGGQGTVKLYNQSQCHGNGYSGVFPT